MENKIEKVVYLIEENVPHQTGYRYDPFLRIEAIDLIKDDIWTGLMIEFIGIYARFSPFLFFASLLLFLSSRREGVSKWKDIKLTKTN